MAPLQHIAAEPVPAGAARSSRDESALARSPRGRAQLRFSFPICRSEKPQPCCVGFCFCLFFVVFFCRGAEAKEIVLLFQGKEDLCLPGAPGRILGWAPSSSAAGNVGAQPGVSSGRSHEPRGPVRAWMRRGGKEDGFPTPPQGMDALGCSAEAAVMVFAAELPSWSIAAPPGSGRAGAEQQSLGFWSFPSPKPVWEHWDRIASSSAKCTTA